MAISTNLDVSVETASNLERRMTVRVPNTEIEREIAVRLRKVGKTARIKGFRPGKVPVKVVRQRYGGQIRQEVLSDIIQSSYSRAISQQQLQPAGGPSIEPLSGADDEHFSYRATFEVYPEITLKGVASLDIEVPVVAIKDADIDEMIEKLRTQRAEWQVIERPAAAGDQVTVDFVGTIAKQPFEGGEGKEVPVVLGSGQMLEEFDKALQGVAAGEEKSAKVKFPKDYPAEQLAGKKAVFDITVHRVEEQVLPALDEEFFETFGVTDDGMDGLKKEVLSNMQRELDERLRTEKKSRTLNALLKANELDVPNSLVQQEISNIQADTMRRMGIDDLEKAPARENFSAAAKQRVTLGLLVQALISEHSIDLDQSRVEERIKELVAPYEKPEEASQIYRGNRDLMAQVESTVFEDQVVEYLLEQGSAKEKEFAFGEFMAT